MAAIRSVLCFVLISMISEIASGNYCDICIDHTMCRAHYLQPGCRYYSYGLNQDQKNRVVNLHNQLRQKVASGNERRGSPGPQPPATYIPNLVWDDEIAYIAQVLANSCNFAHDSCRNVQRFKVGQNIAYRSAEPNEADVTKALLTMVQDWYEEVKLFNRNGVQNYVFDYRTGHYTQMLWAETTKVGCGYTHMTNSNRVLLVCNYGPAGNINTRPIYPVRR